MKAATVKEQIELSSSIHMEEVWYPAFLKLCQDGSHIAMAATSFEAMRGVSCLLWRVRCC